VRLDTLDWIVLVLYGIVCVAIGLAVTRRAGQGRHEFFLSGRRLPWWLLGVSLVATTFSTDTPNLITDLVRTGGVSQNWVWWAFAVTGMCTVFFYAKLWRRSAALTDIAFYELRYSGKPAAFLRGFRAIYLGVFFNLMIMASVNLSATKIAGVMLGWDRGTAVLVGGAVTVLYAASSGLSGVVLTDFVQFIIAMVGAVLAAVVALGLPKSAGCRGCSHTPRWSRACRSCPTSRIGARRPPSSSCRWRCSGGARGIPVPSREAGATWRSACSPRPPSATPCARPCCSTYSTTPCGPGRGSS